MGNLDKVWLEVPEDFSEESLQQSFRTCFGAEWSEVLDTADEAFSYNASNNAYFAVRDIFTVKDLTLDQLLEKEGADIQMNIIVS